MVSYYKIPLNVGEDIRALEEYVERYKRGEITHAKFRGFRVPLGIYEQREKDVFMMRIRIPGGGITPSQLREIARIARDYGAGLHITTRQDIQLQNVQLDHLAPIYWRLYAIKLTCKGGGGNTVRNLTACPDAGVCKHEAFDVLPYCVALTEYLIQFQSSYNLPRKFKISFSGCSRDCALATVNDVGFIAKEKDGEIGFSVYAAGGMGAISRVALKLHDFVPANEVGYIAEAVKRLFDRYGDRRNKHRARLRFIVDRIGEHEFIKLYERELEAVKADGLIELDIRPITEFRKLEQRIAEETPKDRQYEQWINLSVIEQKQPGYYMVRIPVPLGDIEPNKAEYIADICEQLSGVSIRTTQTQDLLIRWIHYSELPFIYNRLREMDLADGRKNISFIVCCRGAGTCKLGLCRSQDLTRAIAEELDSSGIMLSKIPEVSIRINGCPNACGQSPIGSIGLHGLARRVGNRPVPFYAISVGGHVEEGKTKLSEPIGQIPAKNVPMLVRDFLAAYLERKEKCQSFEDFWGNDGKRLMRQLIERYRAVPSYDENPEYYRDYGSDVDFSLAGKGVGECGAGVLDMIESDIEEAKKAYETYLQVRDVELLHKAVVALTRSLLIIRGIDPKDEFESIEQFERHFVNSGWVSGRYCELLSASIKFRKYGDKMALVENQGLIPQLMGRIIALYQSLDANLRFQIEPEEKQEKGEIEGGMALMTLDLRGTPCPINYVRAKLALETMDIGDILEVLLDDGEPIRNVPASLENDGQEIVEIRNEGEHWSVKVRRRV
ncbi:MAG: sulfurtransferase TusA family protein [Armatimonadota bacterium]|nr:sulfurtransferase TusA family protein [Armatimonadota bacterium]MDW8026554.1 sulfurtransferase TusA family protein [Armatimonadota bacterium]